ncbi:hypothetical protein CLOM_g1663 [Closterium sp. NIES-68]|nr:hypothetical protein CLOM_g1663 [Closterium sp. NIES-68]GJP76020.1 hypothetical protein CLOP_g6416 [Closterium sp. NIES-67]
MGEGSGSTPRAGVFAKSSEKGLHVPLHASGYPTLVDPARGVNNWGGGLRSTAGGNSQGGVLLLHFTSRLCTNALGSVDSL